MSDELPNDLIGVPEACRILRGLHRASFYRWIMKGRLRAWKIGREYFVSRNDVMGMIEPVTPKTGPVEPTPRQRRKQQREAREFAERHRMR